MCQGLCRRKVRMSGLCKVEMSAFMGGRGPHDQLATRERQAGPFGMAERLVVPMKPGNSGGGKGPQLKGNARSDEGPRDWR